MAVGALYQGELDKAALAVQDPESVLNLQRDPNENPIGPAGSLLEPESRKTRSAWSIPLRLIKSTGLGLAASVADILKPIGSAGAIAAQANPLASFVLGDEALGRGAAIGKEELDSDEAFTSDEGGNLRSLREKHLPDPLTAGYAEQIVFGVGEPLLKAVGGALIGGVPGFVAAASEIGFQESEALRQQGVSFGARAGVGAVTAGVNTVGGLLPIAGPTLKSTLALYLAGGPGSFFAQTVASRAILEHANYDEAALQYDPTDTAGFMLSTLLPLPFLVPKVTSFIDGTKKKRLPLKDMDAAMAHNLTTLIDDQQINGRPTLEGVEPEPSTEGGGRTSPSVESSSTGDQVAQDAKVVSDVADVADLVVDDDGAIVNQGEFVQKFVQGVAEPNARAALVDAKGELSQAGQLRAQRAVIAATFGDDRLNVLALNAQDRATRDILAGLVRAAPEVARAGGEIGKRLGGLVSDALLGVNQRSSAASRNVATGLKEAVGSPARVAELVTRLSRAGDDASRTAGARETVGLDDADFTADVVEATRTFQDPGPSTKRSENTNPGAEAMRDQLAVAQATSGDMVVRVADDGTKVTLSDEVNISIREANEGTATELGIEDAELFRVVADCALEGL